MILTRKVLNDNEFSYKWGIIIGEIKRPKDGQIIPMIVIEELELNKADQYDLYIYSNFLPIRNKVLNKIGKYEEGYIWTNKLDITDDLSSKIMDWHYSRKNSLKYVDEKIYFLYVMSNGIFFASINDTLLYSNFSNTNNDEIIISDNGDKKIDKNVYFGYDLNTQELIKKYIIK